MPSTKWDHYREGIYGDPQRHVVLRPAAITSWTAQMFAVNVALIARAQNISAMGGSIVQVLLGYNPW